jgi:hypothetical protein
MHNMQHTYHCQPEMPEMQFLHLNSKINLIGMRNCDVLGMWNVECCQRMQCNVMHVPSGRMPGIMNITFLASKLRARDAWQLW